ncbi:MAG: M48 family metalloprotease [Deltaproteobacteria bacterium]|nr:M48 family metalloprotease [Deltaproteobacteria bacterium]
MAWLLLTFSPILQSYGFCASYYNLTNEEERKLGRKFLNHVKKHLALIDDSIIINYITTVGKRIESQMPSQPFTYNFYVVKEDVYNAFAAPAGHVFINSGLLAAMDNEDELAGILAHEMAHVACRHIAKRIERSTKIGLATLAGVLAGIFLGGGGAATGAITAGSIAAGESMSLKYSREDEAEADQVGLRYLTQAGYSAEGLLSVLKKIRMVRWFGPEEIPTYLTTHPAVEERLAYIDTQMQIRPEWGSTSRKIDPYEFKKIQIRLIALYKEPDNSLAYYGMALVLEREGQRETAFSLFKKAILYNPTDPDMLLDLGRAYFFAGNYRQAISVLKGALAFRPRDRKGQFLLGRSYFETGEFHEAIEVLKTLAELYPNFTEGYYYLGNAYAKIENFGEAHYNLGLYFEHQGDTKNAGFHFKRALKLLGNDPTRQKSIRKKLKNLESGSRRGQSEQTSL